MDEKSAEKAHRLEITQRKTAFITGVRDVKSFDEQEIVLDTVLGILLIRGNGLKVERIAVEKGEAELLGKINSMTYSEPKDYAKAGENILKRMFK